MATEMIISKLSSEALGKAVTKSEGTVSQLQQQGSSSFKDILAEMDSGQNFAEMIGINNNAAIDPTGNMQTLAGNKVDFKPGEDATGLSKPDTSQKVVDLLGDVNKGQMQMDSLVNQILYSGKKFSNQELLCIQAHVFHFAQMTELTVKVAEQGVSSVKAVLNTQIQ